MLVWRRNVAFWQQKKASMVMLQKISDSGVELSCFQAKNHHYGVKITILQPKKCFFWCQNPFLDTFENKDPILGLTKKPPFWGLEAPFGETKIPL